MFLCVFLFAILHTSLSLFRMLFCAYAFFYRYITIIFQIIFVATLLFNGRYQKYQHKDG